MDGWIIQRFHNVILIALITAFLVIPVAYLSAYPEAVSQWAGSLLADYCLRTGVCDFHILKAGLGVVLFVLISVFIGFLEAMNPAGLLDDHLGERLEDIEGELEALSSWYVMDNPDEQSQKDEGDHFKDSWRFFTVIFYILVMAIPCYFLVGDSIDGVFEKAVLLSYVLSTLSVILYWGIWTIFFPNKLMFWEKNWVVRKLYQEDQSEPDQA